MRTYSQWAIVATIGIFMMISACSDAGGAAQKTDYSKVEIKTDSSKFAYSLGLDVGTSIVRMGEAESFDMDAFMAGLTDTLNGRQARLTPEEANSIRQAFMQAARERASQKALEDNKKYLAENGAKAGVTTTPSGLQYEVLVEGDGPKPTATDKVTVHYTGTLTNGEKFDSSVDRGQPASFGLNQVIKGWTEGLQLMSVGSKYRFTIPSELGYGAREVGNGAIPANSVLVFDVELLGIGDAPAGQ